jgi:hypothetical protein
MLFRDSTRRCKARPEALRGRGSFFQFEPGLPRMLRANQSALRRSVDWQLSGGDLKRAAGAEPACDVRAVASSYESTKYVVK